MKMKLAKYNQPDYQENRSLNVSSGRPSFPVWMEETGGGADWRRLPVLLYVYIDCYDFLVSEDPPSLSGGFINSCQLSRWSSNPSR